MTESLRDAGFVPARPIGLKAAVVGDARGQWIVLSETSDMDAAQASGRWLKAAEAVEVPR